MALDALGRRRRGAGRRLPVHRSTKIAQRLCDVELRRFGSRRVCRNGVVSRTCAPLGKVRGSRLLLDRLGRWRFLLHFGKRDRRLRRFGLRLGLGLGLVDQRKLEARLWLERGGRRVFQGVVGGRLDRPGKAERDGLVGVDRQLRRPGAHREPHREQHEQQVGQDRQSEGPQQSEASPLLGIGPGFHDIHCSGPCALPPSRPTLHDALLPCRRASRWNPRRSR